MSVCLQFICLPVCLCLTDWLSILMLGTFSMISAFSSNAKLHSQSTNEHDWDKTQNQPCVPTSGQIWLVKVAYKFKENYQINPMRHHPHQRTILSSDLKRNCLRGGTPRGYSWTKLNYSQIYCKTRRITLNFYTLTSGCIFSILLSIHFIGGWQGEFVYQDLLWLMIISYSQLHL